MYLSEATFCAILLIVFCCILLVHDSETSGDWLVEIYVKKTQPDIYSKQKEKGVRNNYYEFIIEMIVTEFISTDKVIYTFKILLEPVGK